MPEENKNKKPAVGAIQSPDRDANVNILSGLSSVRENYNTFHEAFRSGAAIQMIVAEMEERIPELQAIMRIVYIPLGYDRQIEGEGAAADFVRAVFANIKNFNEFLEQCMNCLKYGAMHFELVWGKGLPAGDFNRYVISEIRDWSPDRFVYNEKNELCMYSNLAKLEPVNETWKFKTICYRPQFGNLYGSSIYHNLYYVCKFLEVARKMWAIYCERCAGPHTIISGTDEFPLSAIDHDSGETFLKNIKNMTGLITANPIDVRNLEASQNAAMSYRDLISHCEKIISIALTGRPDSLEIVKGSYAKDVSMTGLRQDVELQYIDLLETFINDQIIPVLLSVNFSELSPAEYPKWRIVKPSIADDPTAFIDAIEKAAKMGIEVPISYVTEKLGIPVVQEGDEVLKPPAAAPNPFTKPEEDTEIKFAELEKIRQKLLFSIDMKSLKDE